METRVRLAIHDDGLPSPVLQHPVGPYAIDLACPGVELGVEYDGRDHLEVDQVRRDLRREAFLARAGWDILRPSPYEVMRRPWRVAAAVRDKLMRAARARDLTLAELDLR